MLPARRYRGAVPDEELVGEPLAGRVFERSRPVRLGDASPGGRLRLDALARYLQDVSNDDTRDAGMAEDVTWVVRRIVVVVAQFPVLGEELALRTFCSAVGQSLGRATGVGGGRSRRTGRRGHAVGARRRRWSSRAAARRVPRRLRRGRRWPHGRRPPPAPGSRRRAPRQRPWPLRFTDYDVLGHVNNAAAWSAVEEVLADAPAPAGAAAGRAGVPQRDRGPARRRAADRRRRRGRRRLGTSLWLTDGDTVFASAIVRRASP